MSEAELQGTSTLYFPPPYMDQHSVSSQRPETLSPKYVMQIENEGKMTINVYTELCDS